jgi:dTDP-4-dehydrorhamnose 3,5-epimerase
MGAVSGGASIAGVEYHPLRVVADERGAVLHMLRTEAPKFARVGEVYFSEVKPSAIKAWKLHLRMTQRLAVPVGQVRFVLYDRRPESPTRGNLREVVLGRPDNYGLLIIPPQVWYGFTNDGQQTALIANAPDLAHDPDEAQRLPVETPEIPYQWSPIR